MSRWLLLVGIVAVLSGGGFFVYTKTRGLRNNNPGNIRHGAQWVGMAAVQNDPAFVTFTDPVYGIRAINKILKSYAERHGINTVRGIINRYAPPSENDTGAYVDHVADIIGANPDQPINVMANAYDITRAIIKHENGLMPYDPPTLQRGVAMGWA